MSAKSVDPFGVRLREARRLKGLSQTELGGERYSGSYISHLESGRRLPTADVVAFLSRRLELSLVEAPPVRHAARTATSGSAIEDLLVASRAWNNQDWDDAIQHASAAAAAAAQAGDLAREWEARYVLAQARFSSGSFTVAAELAEHLAEEPTAREFPVARAQALSLASIANRAADRIGQAVAFGARAVEVASLTPPVVLAEALMSLVSAMFEAGHDAAESASYLARLEALSPRLGSAHSRGMIAWTIGTARFYAGEIEEGLRQYDVAARLLDSKRDVRLWLRYHNAAAHWLLNAGITDGVEDLLQVAATGLELVGNEHDLIELRKAQAMYALRTDRPARAKEVLEGVLSDPVLGSPGHTLGAVHQLIGHAEAAIGRDDAARQAFRRAALTLESEGRLRAALDAWRMSAGQASSSQFLTQG